MVLISSKNALFLRKFELLVWNKIYAPWKKAWKFINVPARLFQTLEYLHSRGGNMGGLIWDLSHILILIDFVDSIHSWYDASKFFKSKKGPDTFRSLLADQLPYCFQYSLSWAVVLWSRGLWLCQAPFLIYKHSTYPPSSICKCELWTTLGGSSKSYLDKILGIH